MASNDTKLGLGLATGMFYHAPAGTVLPTYPAETLNSAWVEVGDVTQDGITLATDKSTENIKNWANVIKRVIMTDHAETISAPLQDTVEETLKVVLGEDNVTVTAANTTHGKLIDGHLSAGTLPEPEAFLFLMKDGDDMIMLGTKHGQITALDNISFAPNGAIVWTPTITAMEDGWHIIVDDGQKSA